MFSITIFWDGTRVGRFNTKENDYEWTRRVVNMTFANTR